MLVSFFVALLWACLISTMEASYSNCPEVSVRVVTQRQRVNCQGSFLRARTAGAGNNTRQVDCGGRKAFSKRTGFFFYTHQQPGTATRFVSIHLARNPHYTLADENRHLFFIRIQPMRERRSFPCGVVCRDRMFVLGGYDGHETLRAVEEYNFTTCTHQWRQAKPMLVARSNAGAAVWNEKLYVVGGWDGRALNAVERFDVTKDEWELLNSLPRPTTGVRCCFLSSKTLNDSREPLDDSNLLSIENSHQAPESNDRVLGRGVLCALTFAAGVISGYAIKKWQMWFAV